MTLAELLDPAEGALAFKAIDVAGLTADSRAVRPGSVFFAIEGVEADGRAYIEAALKAGAVAIITDERPMAADWGVPVVQVAEPRRTLALAAARFFGAQPETTVAVTGTAGKTSVVTFARQIFMAAGHSAASLGTLGVTVGDAVRYGNLTTPDPVTLHRVLKEIADDGVTHLAMEASSHGLDQHRLDGVRLTAAAFTNLGRDHLDYHPTMDAYLAAKLRLFEALLPEGAPAVINADIPERAALAAVIADRGQTLFTYGAQGDDLRLSAIEPADIGQNLVIDGAYGRHAIHLPLAGRFQADNALAAAGLTIAAGIAPDHVFAALGRLKTVPGRLDLAGRLAHGAPVFVDYAHKPDALKSVLETLRAVTAGRLIVVVGAGGDRDPGKRPLMGAAARAAADIVIVTDDNPRSEEPALIRKAILAAVPDGLEIGDREEAIHTAVDMARAGDVVLVAGKGHETGQTAGGVTRPFSDHAVVQAALAQRAAS